MITLFVENKTSYKFKLKRQFKNILKTVSKIENLGKNIELNLIIINNEEMKRLSNEYKKVDKATDILSFPADWPNLELVIGYKMLGDIFISYEKILEQSEKYGHSLKREWCYIFTHGIYHLLGYDHIIPKEEKVMNAKVDNIMLEIGVSRDV